MTVEEKALELVNEVRAERSCGVFALVVAKTRYDCCFDTLCRAIEREQAAIEAHEADKKAFSDAITAFWPTKPAPEHFQRFILPDPEPDPLVEIAREMTLLDGVVRTDNQKAAIREGRAGSTASDEFYDRLRMALPACGYKIERIDQ